MSKLADRIKRAGKVEPAPMGFGAPAERRAAPTLLCLLRLDKDDAKRAAQAATAADGAIVPGAPGRRPPGGAVHAAPAEAQTRQAAKNKYNSNGDSAIQHIPRPSGGAARG